MSHRDKITGCLVGLAIGDAIGLPYERLSRQRQRRLSTNWNPSLFFGYNMFSDDTEHACIVVVALLESKGCPKLFAQALATKLRWWWLGLPAGIGRATLRSGFRLWLGFSPARSGVFSAGNGPAMRSPILGLLYGNDLSKLSEMVRASTIITHSDPKAFYGAMAVAIATYLASQGKNKPDDFWPLWQQACPEDQELGPILRKVEKSVADQGLEALLSELGCSERITGYIYHTVPCVFYFWWCSPEDFSASIEEIIKCGGDTDTNAAVLGAIIGSHVGIDKIPQAWCKKICDWPRSLDWVIKLSDCISKGAEQTTKIPRLNPVSLLLRNLFFLVVITLHGFRRLFPPY